MRASLAKHNLIWVLMFLLIIPCVSIFLILLLGQKRIPKLLHPHYKLVGVTEALPHPPLDFAHFSSHEIQKYVETKIANNLPLRSFFIRMNNQLYYTFFKKSYAEDGHLVIGKSNQLYNDSYVKQYCGLTEASFSNEVRLVAWIDKLKLMNDYFKKQGKTFLYVITPTKSEIISASIPERFHCKTSGISPHINKLVQLLEERHIPYVNGSQLIVDASKQSDIPLFPQGGVHWNMLGASIAANEIIAVINHEGKIHLDPLQYSYTRINKAHGSDRDLLDLLNLMRPNDHYLTPYIKYEPYKAPAKPLTVVMIGGSFLGQLIDTFNVNHVFSKILYYRYFKLYKTEYTAKDIVSSPVDLTPDKIMTAWLDADVIILEENASYTVSNHGELVYTTLEKYFT